MNNLRTPPLSRLSSCKNLPPYFFMVHLLHRLYGVDAPVENSLCVSNITFSATTHRAVFNVKMSVCTAFHITRFDEYLAKFNINVNLFY